MLGRADFVVPLLPVTPETCGFVHAARLALMRPTARLLDFARGEPVVDQDLEAAAQGRTALFVETLRRFLLNLTGSLVLTDVTPGGRDRFARDRAPRGRPRRRDVRPGLTPRPRTAGQGIRFCGILGAMPPGLPRVRYAENPFHQADLPADLLPVPDADPRAFHRGLPGYAPTPLVALPALAAELGLDEVWVKDESVRFGLGAFKALGGAYAVHRLMQRGRPAAVATATAGNHGRGVAWAARTLGLRAVIFVPGYTVPARIEALRREGAEVVVVDGSYEDALHRAAAESTAHGWQVVSDTAYPGYTEIPVWIMTAYTTLFAEAAEQLAARGAREPDLVLLQAGVGGLAWAGVFSYGRRAGRRRPRLVAVEPLEADCLRESAASPGGEPSPTRGRLRTIMAGLNAGTPSLVAWPLLRAALDGFLAVDDGYAEEAMRQLHGGGGTDPRVVAGESGAAGLAGLLALCREPALDGARRQLGVGVASRVLLVVSEGATDPASYRAIVGAAP